MEKGTVILLVGLAGAGGFALAYSQSNSSHSPSAAQTAQPPQQEDNEPEETQQQQQLPTILASMKAKMAQHSAT